MRYKIDQEKISNNKLLDNFLNDPSTTSDSELDKLLNLNYNEYTIPSIHYLNDFAQFLCLYGAIKPLEILEEKKPGKFLEMINTDPYTYAYQLAVENGHLEILKYLEKFPYKIQMMIANNSYGVFLSAAEFSQPMVLQYLAKTVDAKYLCDANFTNIINWCLFVKDIDACGILLMKVPKHFELEIQDFSSNNKTAEHAEILIQALKKYGVPPGMQVINSEAANLVINALNSRRLFSLLFSALASDSSLKIFQIEIIANILTKILQLNDHNINESGPYEYLENKSELTKELVKSSTSHGFFKEDKESKKNIIPHSNETILSSEKGTLSS